MTQAMRQLRLPLKARPNVRVAGLFPLQSRKFDHVYHSAAHAIHLHEYAGTIRLAGKDHPLEPGTLTISPANEESSYDLPRPGVHWCIHFDAQQAAGGARCLSLPLVRYLGSAQGEAVRRFSYIARLRSLRVDAEALAVAMQEFLIWVAMLERVDSPPASAPSNQMIQQLLDYIDRNLDQIFRAQQLAERSGFSQNHLARMFRQRLGTTLPRYVLTRRIGLARLLLATTNLPIKQIAMRVGMPDPHHFNKQFRAIVGTSPSDFRAG